MFGVPLAPATISSFKFKYAGFKFTLLEHIVTHTYIKCFYNIVLLGVVFQLQLIILNIFFSRHLEIYGAQITP